MASLDYWGGGEKEEKGRGSNQEGEERVQKEIVKIGEEKKRKVRRRDRRGKKGDRGE